MSLFGGAAPISLFGEDTQVTITAVCDSLGCDAPHAARRQLSAASPDTSTASDAGSNCVTISFEIHTTLNVTANETVPQKIQKIMKQYNYVFQTEVNENAMSMRS